MSIGWICNFDYADGIHKVKHKETSVETFVELDTASVFADEIYYVVDCKTGKTVPVDDYDHVAHYVNGNYYECIEHNGIWLFDDGKGVYDECSKCKKLADEILSFKVAEDVYQYNSNKEFNRLKQLLKADEYRLWKFTDDSEPKQGLFILITEYDSEYGDTYYYYKTIERDFMKNLNWNEDLS